MPPRFWPEQLGGFLFSAVASLGRMLTVQGACWIYQSGVLERQPAGEMREAVDSHSVGAYVAAQPCAWH